MKIVHISRAEYQGRGGASRAANRLHKSLRAARQDSWMFVENRETGDPNVIVFGPPSDLTGRLSRVARRALVWRDLKHVKSDGLSDDRSQYGSTLVGQLPEADIFHLHWVNGFLDYRLFLPAAGRRAPLVWTLHDMNPLTGGCDCAEGCGRHASQCGNCPFVDSGKEDDLSRAIWKRKRAAYQKIAADRLQIVAPSRWLASEARRSTLLGDRPITVIPHGLDLNVFSPKDRIFARQFLDLPQDKKIILWAAWALAGSERRIKGPQIFMEALAGLKDRRDLLVVSVGRGTPSGDLGVPHVSLGYLSDDRLMALAYSAADVYVSSSLQESFGYTILESMACGVPVVAFNVTGIPDLVRDGVTGTLAPSLDSEGLRSAIVRTLADPSRLAQLGQNSRRIAVEDYSLETWAKRYTALYEELLVVNRGNVASVVPSALYAS